MMRRTTLAGALIALLVCRGLPAEEAPQAPPSESEIPRAMVMVVTSGEDGAITGRGIGVLIAPGRVLCRRRPLLDAERVGVISAGKPAREVKVLGEDTGCDMVLLKADGLAAGTNGLPPAAVAPRRGETVYVAAASPEGSSAALIQGKVQTVLDMGLKKAVRIDLRAPEGCSGGPVINADGEVLGFAIFSTDPVRECTCLFSADRIPPLQASKPVAPAKWQKKARGGGDTAASQARFAAGFEAVRRGRLRESARAWYEAVEEHPDDAEAWTWYGRCRLRRSNIHRALEAFKEAVRLAPDSPAAHFGLGIAHARKDNLDKARAAFEKVISLGEDDSRAWLALGVVCERRGKPADAAAAYKAALEREPGLVHSMLRPDPDDSLAWLLGLTGPYVAHGGRPAGFFDAALKIDPDSPEALVGRTWAELDDTYDINCYRLLFAPCRKALEMKADLPEAWYVIGLIHHALLEFDDELAAMKKAVEIDPEWALPHYRLGMRYRDVEDLKSAKKHLLALRPLHVDLAEDLNGHIQNLLVYPR